MKWYSFEGERITCPPPLLSLSVSFLWLFSQITINRVTLKKRNVFSHSSGGQKSETEVFAEPLSSHRLQQGT